MLPRSAELGGFGLGAAAGAGGGTSAVAARGGWAGGAFAVQASGGGTGGRGARARSGVGCDGRDEKGRKREEDQGVGAKHRDFGGAAKRQSESYVSGHAVRAPSGEMGSGVAARILGYVGGYGLCVDLDVGLG